MAGADWIAAEVADALTYASDPSMDAETRRRASLVLVAEVRALRARVAELERAQAPSCTCDYSGIADERHKDWCEIEGGPHADCRTRIEVLESRVAELEAERAASGVEWAVSWFGPAAEGGGIEECETREAAEALVRLYPGQCALYSRSLGPWEAAE